MLLLRTQLRSNMNYFCSHFIGQKVVMQSKAEKEAGKCYPNLDNNVYRQTFILFGYTALYQSEFSSVQSLSCVQFFAIPWTAACQASLSVTNSQSLFKLSSIELVMPSNHLILCRPLLPMPSIFPSIRVFSNESVLCFRQSQYWSFSLASFLPMNFQD